MVNGGKKSGVALAYGSGLGAKRHGIEISILGAKGP